MLSAAVVTVGLMLGGHFEAPREMKFQGALLPESELDRAIRERPSLAPGGIVLGVSGGVTAVGLALMIGGFVSGGWGGVAVAFLGVVIGVVGLIGLVVGAIVMIATAVARADADQQIELLRKRDSAAPPPPVEPPPPPPSVQNTPFSGAVLARF